MANSGEGITFKKEDLIQINLADVKTQTISRSHFFHQLPGNKFMPLLRAGDFVEPGFISHYLERGMLKLAQLDMVRDEDLVSHKTAWRDLKKALTEKDRFQQRDRILRKIARDFWSNNDKSFLSFVIAAFEEFYVYPPHILDHLQKESSLLYTRSLLIGAVSSITALINGYVDYSFIKDFYNTAFIMDYGLVDFGNFNYVLSLACEAERNSPGSGLQVMKKYNRSKGEIAVFQNHPLISFERAMEQKEMFTHRELTHFIKFHHEKTDGSGFPNGYGYSCMSDAETMLIFCDHFIPFKEHTFNLGDGKLIVKDYFEDLKQMEGAHLLPIRKLIQNWQKAMDWMIREEKEVA